ncbi:MAG: tetratricopeptide repeat protein [Anaerolineae bacterium]|nr:tetratricopeptide repeat protein [Anaerolineae bacterium]MDW8172242.1 tetratricopeptide repeat protein [Anaerolineae bacterium]
MTFFDQLKEFFFPTAKSLPNAINPTAASAPQGQGSALDAILRAKNSEDYAEALRLMSDWAASASAQQTPTLVIDLALNMADIYIVQRDYERAQALLDEARQRAEGLRSRSPLAYVLCAAASLEQARQRWDEADALLQDALRLAEEANSEGAKGRALGHLADSDLHRGETSRAINRLLEAMPLLEASGDTELLPYFASRLAEAYQRSGRLDDAETLLNRALSLATQEGDRRGQRRLQQQLGALALARSDQDKAANHYKAAYQLLPQQPDDLAQAVEILAQHSQTLLAQDGPAAAQPLAERALSLAESLQDEALLALAQASLGLVRKAQGQTEAAQSLLQRASDFYRTLPPSPFSLHLLNQWADLQAALDPKQAIISYQAVADIAGKARLPHVRAQSLTEMGRLYVRLGQQAEASRAFQEALALYRSNRPADAARLHCQLAELYAKQGQSRALREYEQALLLLKSVHSADVRGQVLQEVGHYYMRYGDVDTAESYFAEAVQIAADSDNRVLEAERRSLYGVLLALSSEPQRGLAELAKAQALIGDDPAQTVRRAFILTRLAIAQRANGDLKEALRTHDQALALIGDAPEAIWMAVQKADTLLEQPVLVPYLDEAQAIYARAEAAWRQTEDVPLLILALIGLGRVALLRGDAQAAAPYVEEANALATKAALRRPLADIRALQSQHAALLGDRARAESLWQEAAKLRRILKRPAFNPPWLS